MRKILLFLLLSFGLHALHITDNGELKPAAKELLALFDVPSSLNGEELVSYLEREWLQWSKERWEMDKRFEEKRASAFPLLNELGFIAAVPAQKNHYNYALILGGMGKAMEHELDFLYKEWQRGVRFDQMILLSGARDLDPRVESYAEELKTEADLLVYLFDRHPLKGLVPHVVINAPKQLRADGTLFRPSRANAVSDWLSTRTQPGSCLAVSRQPYVSYQEVVLMQLLPPPFEVEAIGPPAVEEHPLSIYLDNFVRLFKNEKDLAH